MLERPSPVGVPYVTPSSAYVLDKQATTNGPLSRPTLKRAIAPLQFAEKLQF
jgi:hypothetical protein